MWWKFVQYILYGSPLKPEAGPPNSSWASGSGLQRHRPLGPKDINISDSSQHIAIFTHNRSFDSHGQVLLD